jgi:hypothetical protein
MNRKKHAIDKQPELLVYDGLGFLVQRRKVPQSGATGVSLLPPGHGEVPPCTELFVSILTRFFEKQILQKPLQKVPCTVEISQSPLVEPPDSKVKGYVA